jgi:hypothetical protein
VSSSALGEVMEGLNLLRLAAIARFMRPSPQGQLSFAHLAFGERPRLDLPSIGFEDEVTVAAGERPEFLDNQRVLVEVAPGPRGAETIENALLLPPRRHREISEL